MRTTEYQLFYSILQSFNPYFLLTVAQMMYTPTIVLFAIAGAVILSITSGKIDRVGGTIGGLITYGLFLGVGGLGIILIGSFFVLGTLASWWKQHRKTEWGIAEARGGQRGWRNVVANAGVATLIALISWWDPHFREYESSAYFGLLRRRIIRYLVVRTGQRLRLKILSRANRKERPARSGRCGQFGRQSGGCTR